MRTLRIGAAPHSYDGSSYYRMWLPFTHLLNNSRHISGVQRPGAEAPTAQEAAENLDVYVVQRPAGPHGTLLLETLLGHVKLVYEIDDDMLNVESAGLPHLYDERARESIRRCLRLCDMVTVASPHLAEIVRPYNDNIVILPNHIKAGLLDIHRPQRDRVTVGWAGGSTHSWDIEEARGALRHVATYPDVDIHFIGANHSPIVGRPCRWTKWENDVGHYYKNIDFDIAIAPSADHLFNRSKTPIRALEMAALGIPVVASNRLPYSEFVIDGKTGFLVNSPEEWQARLVDLINDEAMRAEMGAAGREQAAGWTIEEGWSKWEAAYESVVDE